MSPSQRDALDRLWSSYGVGPHPLIDPPGSRQPPVNPALLFTPSLPVVLEIGPGMGEATAAACVVDPSVGVWAVDVHTPGLGALLVRAEALALANLRVSCGDALDVLDGLPDASLTGIRTWFPDPWPKARHHKRRLVSPGFLTTAARVVVPDGRLHLATDWAAYADHMIEVVAVHPLWRNAFDGFAPAGHGRPSTRFEAQGHAAGRASYDIVATRA